MSADIPTEFDEESLPNGANRPPHSSVRPTHGGTVSSSIFKSVVKIFVVRCSPNYSRPWQMSSQSHSSSTGFVISNHRILCNAHGVRFAKSIRIRKHGDSKKYDADIEHIGHECDLAILTVSNERFWDNLKPLIFEDKTPKLQDIVVVVGYPIGGDNICVTKGVVSRIGFVSYTHAHENLFSLQIDAAINAGNSGGPTVMNNKVIGVAFETHLNSQNIGYCIPVRVVMHFLNDIEKHQKYTNFPKLGFRWQKIENWSLKKYLKMVAEDYNPRDHDNDAINGILINMIYPLTDAHSKLKENDVLLEIDGEQIGEDGTIKYPVPEDGVSRINYTYITSNKFCGDVVELKILREGNVMMIELKVDIIDYLVPIVLYDRPVTYYIFGGFVFLPLSRPYMRAEFGRNFKLSLKCPPRLKDLYLNGYKEEKEEEVVILSRVLASDINVGYHKFTNCVLEKVNGIQIKNVKQLIEVIEDAIEKAAKFIHFLFEHGKTIVIQIDCAIQGMDKIMKEHKIKHDRSPNLWNKPNAKKVSGQKRERCDAEGDTNNNNKKRKLNM
eukprot:67376_1